MAADPARLRPAGGGTVDDLAPGESAVVDGWVTDRGSSSVRVGDLAEAGEGAPQLVRALLTQVPCPLGFGLGFGARVPKYGLVL